MIDIVVFCDRYYLTYIFIKMSKMQTPWKITILLLFLTCKVHAQESDRVKSVFRDFQSGYTNRDTTQVKNFCDRLFHKDIFIIGTGADEWIPGMSAACTLVKNDWAYWLNLTVDTAHVEWQKVGDVVLFAVKGKAEMTFRNKEEAYQFAVSLLENTVRNAPDNKNKLLGYSQQSTYLVGEIEKNGLKLSYQIRLSGALVTDHDRLVFKQLIFSFPYPMQRLD